MGDGEGTEMRWPGDGQQKYNCPSQSSHDRSRFLCWFRARMITYLRLTDRDYIKIGKVDLLLSFS